jgi:hypothetical protein
LLLPVDPANNERLLRALDSMPENKEALQSLRPQWMDKGHSTALEGDIFIDLLYVAASKTFKKIPPSGGSKSGVISGSDAETGKQNTAANGKAVYVASGSEKRDTTAGEDISLDSSLSGSDGGWE